MERLAILHHQRLLADLHMRFGAEPLFGVLGCPPQARPGSLMVVAEPEAVLLMKFALQALDQKIVKVVAA